MRLFKREATVATLGENPKKHQHRLSAPKNLSQNVAFPNNPTSHQPFPPPVAKQHGLVDLKRFAIVWIDLGKPRADPFPSMVGNPGPKKLGPNRRTPPNPPCVDSGSRITRCFFSERRVCRCGAGGVFCHCQSGHGWLAQTPKSHSGHGNCRELGCGCQISLHV